MSDRKFTLLCEEVGLSVGAKDRVNEYIKKAIREAIEESNKIRIEVVIGSSFYNPSKIKSAYVFDKNEKMEELYFKLEELLEKEGCGDLYLGINNSYYYNGKSIVMNTCAENYYNEIATLVSHFKVNGVLEILCSDLGDELDDSELDDEVDNEEDNPNKPWNYSVISMIPPKFYYGNQLEVCELYLGIDNGYSYNVISMIPPQSYYVNQLEVCELYLGIEKQSDEMVQGQPTNDSNRKTIRIRQKTNVAEKEKINQTNEVHNNWIRLTENNAHKYVGHQVRYQSRGVQKEHNMLTFADSGKSIKIDNDGDLGCCLNVKRKIYVCINSKRKTPRKKR